MKKNSRIIAYYLPQFHPVPENDLWWGKGFTEWTNVTKARPLYRGHHQPKLPADLGYYDLRVSETREAQAEMARAYGIEGFCYYHYWFGDGKMLLERPFNEVLDSGKPDFPFSLCWANETWKGIWFGETNKILMKQTYPGKKDIENHFNYLLKAFTDPRYIKVDEKPVFQILTPGDLPDSREMTDTLRELAHKNGLKGLFLVAGYRCPEGWNPLEYGFDAVVSSRLSGSFRHKSIIKQRLQHLANGGYLTRFLYDPKKTQKLLKNFYHIYDYKDFIEFAKIEKNYPFEFYPCALPNWDNTPRSGIQGYVLENSTPELFKEHLSNAIDYVQKYGDEHKIVFIKSWNEWAEGNYLEPDRDFGMRYLEVVKECLQR